MSPEDCYDPTCTSCSYSAGDEPPGGIVQLDGDWTLNHYGGSEGYLGWLALQPRCHKMALSELTPTEAQHLGPNIQNIDRVVSDHFSSTFSDPVERMYVVYFFESASTHPYHLHIHLIPRMRTIENRLRAWEAPRATKSATFPNRYRNDAPTFEHSRGALMDTLRVKLQTRD